MRKLAFMLPSVLLAACVSQPAQSWHEAIQPAPKIPLKARIVSIDDVFPEQPPFSCEQAFFMLLNAAYFCPLPYGEGDAISKDTVAFTTLVGQPDAPSVFLDLVRRGTPEGKLYGLCGLYLVDRRSLNEAIPPFLANNSDARITRGGCVIGPEPISKIVGGPGDWDILHGRYPRNLSPLADQYLKRLDARKRREHAKEPTR